MSKYQSEELSNRTVCYRRDIFNGFIKKNIMSIGLVIFIICIDLLCTESGALAGSSEKENSGDYLTLYTEKKQGAFHILIPKGWKAEGGMIPSGVEWNIVDLIETNIRFRVTSPDGKSFFGWYPRFYFQDPRIMAASSGGMLQLQPGHTINGCWMYPYMNIAEYVRTIVFGQFAATEFINPRITGNAVESPELKPLVPSVATSSSCGYVNFECSIADKPSFGRMYAIIYDLGGQLWSTTGTFGLVAPKDRWTKDERLMEYCIRTFRLDPAWVKKATAASAQRAKKYGQTMQELAAMDQEIQKSHSQTLSDTQTEFYKVLTGQIETRDPETGQGKWLPSYNKAYTDGKGNYFLTDHEGSGPDSVSSEWKQLQIINRNER